MSYPAIVRKKIRMRRRFGHLPPLNASTLIAKRIGLTVYFCHRCGAKLRRPIAQ